MTNCTLPQHENHTHPHGPECGHTGIMHDGHVDYLHNGHLHHLHDGHVDEHMIDITVINPKNCTPEHQCAGHPQEHTHGSGCGHEAVPHGEHIDYLVDGHLHHPHNGHCDDHGPVTVL